MGSKPKGPSFDEQRNTLISQIKENKDITDETRKELLGRVGGIDAASTTQQPLFGSVNTFTGEKRDPISSGRIDQGKRNSLLSEIAGTFQQAQEGKGVFGYRQKRRDTIINRLDKPGLSNQLG